MSETSQERDGCDRHVRVDARGSVREVQRLTTKLYDEARDPSFTRTGADHDRRPGSRIWNPYGGNAERRTEWVRRGRDNVASPSASSDGHLDAQ